MHSIGSILWLVPILGVVGLFWFLADIRFAQRWSLKRAELGAQDRWRELNAHFESAIKCRRPMLLLFQRFVIPGLLEADYSLHLSNQGEHGRALVLAEKASCMSSRRPEVQLAVLPAQATILLRLGRYAEAKDVVRLGKKLLAVPPSSGLDKALAPPDRATGILLQEGLIELSLGNLDAALHSGIKASAGAVPDPAQHGNAPQTISRIFSLTSQKIILTRQSEWLSGSKPSLPIWSMRRSPALRPTSPASAAFLL
jgi:hypothetical protein